MTYFQLKRLKAVAVHQLNIFLINFPIEVTLLSFLVAAKKSPLSIYIDLNLNISNFFPLSPCLFCT